LQQISAGVTFACCAGSIMESLYESKEQVKGIALSLVAVVQENSFADERRTSVCVVKQL
jgi:hypothetical protein